MCPDPSERVHSITEDTKTCSALQVVRPRARALPLGPGAAMPLRLLLSDIDGTLAHPRRALDAAGCALEARAACVLLRELPPRALRPLPPSSTGQVRAPRPQLSGVTGAGAEGRAARAVRCACCRGGLNEE